MGTLLRALAARLTLATLDLRHRAAVLRQNPDRGSHSVEYAIGIGAAAAVVLLLFAAYKKGVAGVVKSWVLE